MPKMETLEDILSMSTDEMLGIEVQPKKTKKRVSFGGETEVKAVETQRWNRRWSDAASLKKTLDYGRTPAAEEMLSPASASDVSVTPLSVKDDDDDSLDRLFGLAAAAELPDTPDEASTEVGGDLTQMKKKF